VTIIQALVWFCTHPLTVSLLLPLLLLLLLVFAESNPCGAFWHP
jgi:hypothetical protein